MPDFALLILAGGGLALGASAAEIGGSEGRNWRSRLGAIQGRPSCLPRGAASGRGRAAGLALLTLLLAGGALSAHGAEPSAPDRLAREVVGVTGSGDKLNLYVKDGAFTRLLHPGDDYADGWKLKALTPSEATLVKGLVTRRVGLNPTGALSSTAKPAAPSQVLVVMSDDELLAHAMARGVWDGVKLERGMNLAQTRRFYILNEKFEIRLADFMAPYYADAKAAGRPRPMVSVTDNDIFAALGPGDARAYQDVINQSYLAIREQQQAVFDQYGAVTRHMTAAQVEDSIFAGPSSEAQQPYGQNALWKFVQRNPDGSIDQVLSAPGPGDDRSLPLSATDDPGPFEPKVMQMENPMTMFNIGGRSMGLVAMPAGHTAAATVTVDGRNYALPSNVASATTVLVGDVSYPVAHAPEAAAP